MQEDILILVAEDDDGHFALIARNLVRSGITNTVVRFKDGQTVLDFLADAKSPESDNYRRGMLLLLDIRMPKVDGINVLAHLKADEVLRKIPIIILSTSADHKVIEQCRQLGSTLYVVKPVEYEQFVSSIQKISQFLSNLDVPTLSGC